MGNFCTLRQMIIRNLEYNPDRTALIEGERTYSFKEFADRTRSIGNALLGFGLKKGDRVAILSKNSIENAESYFSIPNAGLVMVMLNFRLAPPEILSILKDSGASVLMVNEEYFPQYEQIKEELDFVKKFVFIGDKAKTPAGWYHYETLIAETPSHEPEVEVFEEDLAALMYTSGTTGAAKGCMATHINYYHAGRSLTLEMKMARDDVGIIASPLFHATGEVVLMNDMYSGTPSVILTAWDTVEFMRLVEKHKVTTGMLATPMMLFLVQHPDAEKYNLSSLKKIFFAGAPVTPIVFQKAIERFGNVFVHLFGTTETVGQATILRTEEIADALKEGRTDILASCGRSFADMQSQVVDEEDRPVPPGAVGEMRVRGLGTTLGYWNKEAETRKDFRDGWYYSMDLCKVDEQGFIYVVDRKKDMIITGGENVYPAEVESVLYKHPAVAQTAVIGLKDEKWGEIVTALVIKKPDVDATEEDIRAFCKKEIAGYKVPKKVLFVDTLPMSASGKLLKYKLREQHSR
ncbi:class I adenylate-forming enzyme family protein [Desulforhabdus sp. TSK]|uniref:class I adenylate-forming enzyme family protein n=1 Tax=Desulforhabdus sp. TSK TaxID=2925014 RepID=UPI001FC82A31|nr:long-chain-fatty-acid--CoA ligase [Desulforhabdus sp. TSK]GKT08506.1 fatty-acid--CoA ligase [Desulforhabdus sp. TSK]